MSSTTPPPSKKLSLEEWESMLSKVDISKKELNKLIMNYMVIEGYKDAAQAFSEEADLSTEMDLASIDLRMNVRKAVQMGNIDQAIDLVNEINPEILETNHQLYFHLQQQNLIEFIREGKVEEALDFAQEHLAKRGMENRELLEELERTMVLLLFDQKDDSPVSELLDYTHRQKTASELNAAILTSQSQAKDPKLPTLLKLLAWSQSRLKQELEFPEINDYINCELESEQS